MSKLPTPNPGPRKFDSTSAGQNLLLVFAVVAAAVFAYLYIADKQRKPAREAEPTMAQPPPAAKPVAKTIVSHEPTHIEVEQVLLVAPSAGAPTEKVIVRTPAVYPTGTLQWTAGQVETARALQARLVNVLRHQAAIDRELARIEGEWQRLALEGLPLEALFPDSPSLPQLSPSQPIPPTP